MCGETIFIFGGSGRKQTNKVKIMQRLQTRVLSVWLAVHCETWRCSWYCCCRRCFTAMEWSIHRQTYSIPRVAWAREQYKVGQDFSCERIKCGVQRSPKRQEKKKRYNIRKDCGIYSHLWLLRGRIGIVGAMEHVHAAWFFNSKNTHAPSISALITGSVVMRDSQTGKRETYVCHFMVDCVPAGWHTNALCAATRHAVVSLTRRNLFTCDSISGRMIEIWMRLWFQRGTGARTANQFCHRLSH